MNVLVWQWGRFGGAPRVAVALAQGLAALPGVMISLSMTPGAELMQGSSPPQCELPVATYQGPVGFLWRLLTAPVSARILARKVAKLKPDFAICAQIGPLDLLMVSALKRLGIPSLVLVHDADLHPGDGKPFQMKLQRAVCRRASALASLSSHVGDKLIAQGLAGNLQRPLIRLRLPPLPIEMPPENRVPRQDFHLLSFGRLLPYKGLDLLANALSRMGQAPRLRVRIVGLGPESSDLRRLRAIPNVTVENRWVPEAELAELLSWADALVLPYREASQSGVAALALAAGRRIVATRVGGLPEQLGSEALATLCDPEELSLAEALTELISSSSTGNQQPPDASAAWRDLAHEIIKHAETCFRSRPEGERLIPSRVAEAAYSK